MKASCPPIASRSSACRNVQNDQGKENDMTIASASVSPGSAGTSNSLTYLNNRPSPPLCSTMQGRGGVREGFHHLDGYKTGVGAHGRIFIVDLPPFLLRLPTLSRTALIHDGGALFNDTVRWLSRLSSLSSTRPSNLILGSCAQILFSPGVFCGCAEG